MTPTTEQIIQLLQETLSYRFHPVDITFHNLISGDWLFFKCTSERGTHGLGRYYSILKRHIEKDYVFDGNKFNLRPEIKPEDSYIQGKLTTELLNQKVSTKRV